MQRQKSFTRHFFGVVGWLALGAAVIAIVLALIGQSGARQADRLTHEGADAEATVTSKRRTSDSDGGTNHWVRYAFGVGQETIEARQDVSRTFYQRLSEGDRIPVRYWIGDPAVSEIELGAAASVGWYAMIGAAVAAAVALVLARISWKSASNATWMGRHGLRRQVTVAAHRQTLVEINEVPQWKATWREADGREGASRMARREKLPAVGSPITILVDPEGRRDSLWEGDLLS